MDWELREKSLKGICKQLKDDFVTSHTDKPHGEPYPCVVAVSGGKDSTVIVARLVEKYGLKPLLVTVTDEFTHTEAGKHNIKNIAERFNLDHIVWRCQPKEFIKRTREDFLQELHPLKWIEEQIYEVPVMIAKRFGIPAVFFGENSAFQYGTSKELDTEHPSSTAKTKVYYYFAFERYSETENHEEAKDNGFIDLSMTKEWERDGNIEDYSQIDSIGYIIQLWTKFVKFGFQRVTDMTTRWVRAGDLTRDEALTLIELRDWKCDTKAKKDFCATIGISEQEFDAAVDKHANTDIVKKDANGQWKLA